MNSAEKTLWFFLVALMVVLIGVSAVLFFKPGKLFSEAETETVSTNDSVLYRKIAVAYDISDYEKSLNLISDFLVEYPGSEYLPNVLLTAAQILYIKGKYEDAAEYAAMVLGRSDSGDSHYVDAVILLGRLMKVSEKYDPVTLNYLEDAYLKAGAGQKNEVAVYLGFAYLYKGEYETALTYFNRSTDELAFIGKAEVYRSLERYPYCIEEYESYLSLYPNGEQTETVKPAYVETVYEYAETLEQSESYDDAAQYFVKILNLNQSGDYAEAALYRLANIYYDNDQPETALEFAESGLENDTTGYDDDFLFMKGLIYYELDLKSEALNQFRKLIKNYPDSEYLSDAEEWLDLIRLEFQYAI